MFEECAEGNFQACEEAEEAVEDYAEEAGSYIGMDEEENRRTSENVEDCFDGDEEACEEMSETFEEINEEIEEIKEYIEGFKKNVKMGTKRL